MQFALKVKQSVRNFPAFEVKGDRCLLQVRYFSECMLYQKEGNLIRSKPSRLTGQIPVFWNLVTAGLIAAALIKTAPKRSRYVKPF